MFQFTIRELLLITLGAALMIGWSLDHRWQDAARKAAEADSKYNAQELVRVQGEISNIRKYGLVTENPALTPLTLELPLPTLDLY